MQDTPQAQIPNLRGPGDYLKDAVDSRQLQVDPPNVIALAQDTPTLIWADDLHVALRFIHNVGLVPIKYSVNTEVTADQYHDVLAAGNAAADGLGSQVDLSRFKGAVYAMAVGGEGVLATFRAFTNEKNSLS